MRWKLASDTSWCESAGKTNGLFWWFVSKFGCNVRIEPRENELWASRFELGLQRGWRSKKCYVGAYVQLIRRSRDREWPFLSPRWVLLIVALTSWSSWRRKEWNYATWGGTNHCKVGLLICAKNVANLVPALSVAALQPHLWPILVARRTTGRPVVKTRSV